MDSFSAHHSPLGRLMFLIRFTLIPSICALVSCLLALTLNTLAVRGTPLDATHLIIMSTAIVAMASAILNGSVNAKETAKGAAICILFTTVGTLAVWAMTTYSVDSKLVAFVNFFIVAPIVIVTLTGIYSGADRMMYDGDKFIISRK